MPRHAPAAAFVLLFGGLGLLLVATAATSSPVSDEAVRVYSRYLEVNPEPESPSKVAVHDVITDSKTGAVLTDRSISYVDCQRRRPEDALHDVGLPGIPDDQRVIYGRREDFDGREAYRVRVRKFSPGIDEVQEYLIEAESLQLRELIQTIEYTLEGRHTKRVATVYDFGVPAPFE